MKVVTRFLLILFLGLSGCVSDNAWYYYECGYTPWGDSSGLVEGYVEDYHMFIMLHKADGSQDIKVGHCEHRYVPDEEAEVLDVLKE